MAIWFLEKYSSTTLPKGKYKPLMVKMHVDEVRKIVRDYLVKNKYENFDDNEDYLDLYCERNGFEVSFEFTKNGLNTVVNISVFGENKRGRTPFELKRLYREMINLLNCGAE